MTEWVLSSLHRTAYGRASTVPAIASMCCEEICVQGGWPLFHQCTKSRGYGPEQAYCKVHDPVYVAKKKDAAKEKASAASKRDNVAWAAQRLFNALCRIADGDNDPVSIAHEAIKDLRP